MKVNFALKNKSWKNSFVPRMEIAIIKWNKGNSYYSKLMESLGILFKDWQIEELRNRKRKEKDRKNKQKTGKAEEKRKINRKNLNNISQKAIKK